MGLQLFSAEKQITSWKCDLGKVWQGQDVSAPLRISWHGSRDQRLEASEAGILSLSAISILDWILFVVEDCEM